MNNQDGLARAKKRANAKIGFYIHLLVYVIVNVMLIAINLLTTPGRLWFEFPLLGWGVGVLAHGLAVFAFSRGPKIQQWMIDKEMKQRPSEKA